MTAEPERDNESNWKTLWDDPVIEEVRAARQQLWEAAGRDVRRYLQQSRKAEQRRQNQESKDDSA